MTLDEYQPLAARTAPMDVPVPIQQATFSLGLVCEATEVLELLLHQQDGTPVSDRTLTKELGDVLWYAAGLCTLFDLRMGEVCTDDPERALYAPIYEAQNLAVEAGKVSDYMKKVVGHGHEMDTQRLANGLRLVHRSLASLCSSHNLDLGDVATANVEKLRRRYPEGFSTEASIHRGPEA